MRLPRETYQIQQTIAQVHRVHHSVVRRVARDLEDLEAERLVEENNQSGSCPKRLPMDQSAT